MKKSTTRKQRQQFKRRRAAVREAFKQVPRDQWPETKQKDLIEVWMNHNFLCQVYQLPDGVRRIAVNALDMDNAGDDWNDGIGWNELQIIKRRLGYGDSYALEVYPCDRDIVDVANMRHLWILPKPLNIGWFRNKTRPQPE